MTQSRLALDEDGLRLWAAVLRNATSLSSPISAPSLYDVLPIVLSLLSENLDILGPILNVLRSYFVIGAEQILQVSIIVRHHFSQRHNLFTDQSCLIESCALTFYRLCKSS